VVIKEMGPYVDEVLVDRWGNVIGVKRGSSDYRAMVAAHMDEIGLVVDYIDKDGFLRTRPIGGWSEVTLAGQRVWVRTVDGRWERDVAGSRCRTSRRLARRGRRLRLRTCTSTLGLGAGRRWRGWA
jgi:Cellulase M and related proteins